MKKNFSETDLAALAKQFRERAGKNRAQTAREMGVSQTSVFHSEESPEKSLTKLRIRIIEKYSRFKVKGPIYLLEE